MSTLLPPRRPWAVIVLAAGLLGWFLAVLILLGFVIRHPQGALISAIFGNGLLENFVVLAHVLAVLFISPLAAVLLLRRRALGQRLALALQGYFTVLFAGQLLYVYGLTSFSDATGVLIWTALILASGLPFYLALRPEVFAYTRPEQTSS